MTQKTPLYDAHIAAGAHMVNFYGWEMPLHYGSQLHEHHVVRQHAAVFDVSHMLILDILGAGGRHFLRKLLTNDIDKIPVTGGALYSCMCNENGGIIDDLIVYQRSPDQYRVILNAGKRKRDLEWIHAKSEGFSLGLQERNDLAILAVQGPEAFEKLSQVLAPAQWDAVSTLRRFECVEVQDWFFARTGYTGEDGLEILIPKEDVRLFWDALLAAGVQPCGLGARDTLRLEAGFLLSGQDMDETTTPLESGLAWTVMLDQADRDFIGKGALLSQKAQGPQQKMVGLVLEEKGVMRHGQTVWHQGQEIGVITSGTYSPTRGDSIALARIASEVSSQVTVDIRGKRLPAKIVPPRFLKKG
ncbi:MAG: glycine cleavage system aminomethyltransferase GcvT [Legionellaceae bacterium]|nr:glycine cleavage system aminomethyltransferase GcvT [Legionellaceae bacterium]